MDELLDDRCLDDDTAAAFVDRGLPPDLRHRVVVHLDRCTGCRLHVAALARMHDGTLDSVDVGAEPPAPELLRAGQIVGRYRLERLLGAGGMGVVWLAHDPELQRFVALKLPRRALLDSGRGAATMRREARALAQLHDPRIVEIYDVGLSGDRGYIAMRFIDGLPLDRWAAVRRPKAWREILRVCVEAGRGLAAAHRAGLVHRDVKPSNIMVDPTGRPFITDFGLSVVLAASTDERVSAGPKARSDEATPATADAPQLPRPTETGTLIGTPPYMAPEQHRGEAAVEASDQYAFCVALFEALYGVRPFRGDDHAALLSAKLRGVPEVPIEGRRDVPAWLHATIVRGLAPVPAGRWPTMDDLLRALARGRARARPLRVVAVAGALGLAATGVFVSREVDIRQRTRACEEAGESIALVWNEEARTRVREALVATGVSYAATTADKLMPWLDTQADAWQHARTEACLDGDVRARWDEDTLDRSLWCLDERRMELEALVSELVDNDAAVQSAVTAAAGLTSVAQCRDADMLGRLLPPPLDRRESARALLVQLSRAAVLELTGELAEGLELARAVREGAETLPWPPLVVAARHREASLLADLGAYDEAQRVGAATYYEAVRLGRWDVAERAATLLISVVRRRGGRHAEGLEWARHAEAALTRATDPEGLREAARLDILGNLHLVAGEHSRARELQERALAIIEAALGPDHPSVAYTLNNLAMTHYAAGEIAQARTYAERALAIREKAFGLDHLIVASTLNNLAVLCVSAGDHAQARALFEQALVIREKALGPHHADVAGSLDNLAIMYHKAGDSERARTLHERALLGFEKALGPDHPDVADSLNNLAVVYSGAGEVERAQELYERALVIREKALGPDHPDVAQSLRNLGALHYKSAEYAQARTLHRRALAIYEKALGPDHADVARTLHDLARAHAATGEYAQARTLLERALAIHDRIDGEQDEDLEVRFALAEALVATRGDRARAVALAEQARDGWRARGEADAKQLEDVEAWLRRVDR